MPIQRPRILHAAQMAGTGVVSPSNLDDTAQSLSNKNLIINGAMQVQQRGDVTSSSSVYGLDRFRFSISNSGTVGQYQDTTVPAGKGFSKSTRIQWTSQNNSLDAVDFNYLNQPIEGLNLQHLKFGTSSAESLTLSFWVRSSVTGNYACGLYQADGDKNFVKTYTISAANTWQHVKLTFAGNTANAIANDNTRGLEVMWGLAFGSNYTGTDSSGGWTAYGSGGGLGFGQTANVSSSASNTWYITGAQLEVGNVATEFEHEPVERTIEKCQRYYLVYKKDDNPLLGTASYYRANLGISSIFFPTRMRASPTIVENLGATGNTSFVIHTENAADYVNSLAIARQGDMGCHLEIGNGSGTIGHAGSMSLQYSDQSVEFKAEL